MSVEKALEPYFAHTKHIPRILQEIVLPQDANRQVEMIRKLNMVPQLVDWNSGRIEEGVKRYLWNPVKKALSMIYHYTKKNGNY